MEETQEESLVAFGKRVIVKPEERKTKTASGLQIPDNMTEQPMRGVVVSSGVDTIVPGATIIYGRYCGAKVKFKNEELVILNEEDVLAVVQYKTEESEPTYKYTVFSYEK